MKKRNLTLDQQVADLNSDIKSFDRLNQEDGIWLDLVETI